MNSPQNSESEIISPQNKKEIFYNLVNSFLAGALVFLGSFVNGGFSWTGFTAALITSSIVAVMKFKEFWDGEKPDYCKCLLNII